MMLSELFRADSSGHGLPSPLALQRMKAVHHMRAMSEQGCDLHLAVADLVVADAGKV